MRRSSIEEVERFGDNSAECLQRNKLIIKNQKI
jgi:hypothetical protein